MEFRETESTEAFLSGGGEMGKLIRSMDWSATALGPIEQWPQSLRTSVSLCLSSTFPILIAWGPETIQIYNDSYRPICGAKHPESMGQNFRICWETALPVVGDKFDRGQQGEGTYITDQRMFLDRYGYLEESWMTFSFAPIRDESGGVGGIFHPITESTEKMLSGRRTQALRDLGAAIGKAKSVEEIGQTTQQLYQDYLLDLPFMLLYQLDKEQPRLVASAGVEEDSALLTGNWPFDEANDIFEVTNLQGRFGNFNSGPYEIAPHTAIILPLRISGQENIYGYLVAGVSACRALDNAYRNFYGLLGATFNTAISNVYAYEQEQKRAEALAAIDRSKTAFFSNVSHEFRTPLTLMLGPLEDMLQKGDEEFKQPLEATHRNALRLLKLVNNLLDFSRVEAGRAKASYEQADLQQLTIDLASSFRSIIEKAGMLLEVDCGAISSTTYVDKQMWEKIVLNLLSNAFKYTLAGKITVTQTEEGGTVVLKVSDTGVGIPEKELPHMFERFHRVENGGGRTHEGTGIGLSLVHELVHLHGGEIIVNSKEGEGTTFTVTMPTGYAHLPQEHMVNSTGQIAESKVKDAFLQEAASLLNDETVEKPVEATGERVMIVDDNADMRAYLVRLLEPYYTLSAAANGKEALSMLRDEMPALVISDIMMPVMDGKELLKHIRADKRTARLPVIFLSARAGEEARIDGLEAGADDYLVKPFSAAELLSKVTSQIKMTGARLEAEAQLRNLFTYAPVAIAIYRGPKHIVELANTRMLEYWNQAENDVIGHPILERLPSLATNGFGEVMDSVYHTRERFIAGQLPLEVERNGKTETLYINLTLEPIENGIIAVAADVTEQVLAAKELEKSNNTLNLAMEASGMGLWQTEWGSNILEVSDRARQIHAIPLNADLTFDGTLDVVVEEHRDRFLQAVMGAVEQKGRFREDYQIQPYDGGKRKWLNSTGRVHLDENGDVKSVIGTILDITESKEDELRKNDFIGMVSHELKTPLTSLNGFTQMLMRHADKNGDTFSQNSLQKVQQQIKKMTGIINGFLNVSRLEAGKIQLQKETFNLAALVTEMVDEANMTGHTHTISFDDNVTPDVLADRDKVAVVISNLLGNAMKYSPAKSTIKIGLQTGDDHVTFSVADQGLGIKPIDLERLFDRFYRVEDKNTAHIAGFGIGLYLSDEIVKSHGGKVWAESEVGKGSTFYFSLPLAG